MSRTVIDIDDEMLIRAQRPWVLVQSVTPLTRHSNWRLPLMPTGEPGRWSRSARYSNGLDVDMIEQEEADDHLGSEG